jgi:2-dehydropantoate 2-reductase
MKNVVIVGAGAVGALYGQRLNSVCSLSFLVDEERKERYLRNGIIINGEAAPFAYRCADEIGSTDLIIIATKNHHLHTVIEQMKPIVGPSTVILTLLNGIESEGVLAAAFGWEKILHGFAVGLNSTHVSNRIEFTAEGRIVFGERDNSSTDRVAALSELFASAGIEAVVPKDIHLMQWNKFMLNTAYNTISGLLLANYGQLDQKAVKELAYGVCAEVQAVASAEGVRIPDSFIEENHNLVITLGDGKTSMCQDLEAGRTTENEWFAGSVAALGRKHDIPTPICRTLSLLVQAKEAISFMALA